jgi:C4-dicarboxylate-specific signal transduction histidine kinase
MPSNASDQSAHSPLAYLLARPARYWAVAAFLSFMLGMSVLVEIERYAETSQIENLQAEVSRRSVEIIFQTLNGKYMGSLGYLGLTNTTAKNVATGLLSAGAPGMLRTLELLGLDSGAEGCFLVDKDGIVQSSWDREGNPSTGLDVKFRPYFQMAMKGRQSIYAAVSVNTGRRALYFAAPVYALAEKTSPVVGAAAIRLGLEHIDGLLAAWRGPALLVTPNGVVFASTNPAWLYLVAEGTDKRDIASIVASKQFGKLFDRGDPKKLPFSLDEQVVWAGGRRYALATAPVTWNDPQGDWTLALLDDQSLAISVTREILSWPCPAWPCCCFFASCTSFCAIAKSRSRPGKRS